MNKSFCDLEELFNNKFIKIENTYLDKTIQNYNFTCLTKDNYKKIIQQEENTAKIIVIDYYQNKEEVNDNGYFIFCFDKTIFITNISQTSIIKYIIINYLSSTVYCISDIAILFFSKNYPEIRINYFPESYKNFINNYISIIFEYIEAKNQQINRKLNKLKKCISCYLLLKSYKKSIQNKLNSTMINKSKEQICSIHSKDKYITLNNFMFGSNKTYLKYDIKNERLCVIKSYYKNNSGTKLFNREIKNYQNLNHPFIPVFYEWFEDDEYFYISIEYINGQPLTNIDLNKLKENEIINIIFEILIVIHYLHSLGYIYRDLKPSNIIIDSNHTAILIDFDRLIQNSEDDEIHTMYFNHDGISPEISEGKLFTNKTDIYSIGVLITKLLINQNISEKISSKLKIMRNYCILENPEKRPTISQLIRYYYLNILLTIDEKKEIKNELVKILEYNFEIPDLIDPDGFCTLGMIFDHDIYIDENVEKAMTYYKYASDQNDLISNVALYSNYIDDKYLNKNLAEKYLLRGAEKNDELALLLLGNSHTIFNMFEFDLQKGIQYFIRSANQGMYISYYMLGVIYYKYSFLNKSNESVKCFHQAIDYEVKDNSKNDLFYNHHGKYILPDHDTIQLYELQYGKFNKISPMLMLAKFYLKGIIVKQDISEAIKYFTNVASYDYITVKSFDYDCNLNGKLFKNNNRNFLKNIFDNTYNSLIDYSKRALGLIYSSGIYIQRDLDKAIYYLKNCSEHNSLQALIPLVMIYSNENYKCFDIKKAVEYFLQAMNISYTRNYNMLDFISSYKKLYSNSFLELCDDDLNELAIEYSYIFYNFANICYNGLYVHKDINKAIELFKYSSYRGNSDALYKLGMIYLYDENVPRNVNDAINYLVKSAALNNSNSQQQLGIIYYEGKIVKKDINKAISYFLDSAKEENISQFYLGVIYYVGKYINRNLSKSVFYFKESSNKKDPYSKNNLGIMIKNGEGFKKNLLHSIQLLEESININNNEAARFNLAHIYFYENNYAKSIELLVKPSLISYEVGFQLLCLVLIKKCQRLLSFDNIEEEIREYNFINSSSIAYEIFNEISSKKLNNSKKFEKLYNEIKEIELIYVDRHNNIITRSSIEKNNDNNKSNVYINKKNNINIEFYEGFGNDLLSYL